MEAGMSATPETLTSPTNDVGANDLSRFGYTQQLSRRVGSYASFAAVEHPEPR